MRTGFPPSFHGSAGSWPATALSKLCGAAPLTQQCPPHPKGVLLGAEKPLRALPFPPSQKAGPLQPGPGSQGWEAARLLPQPSLKFRPCPRILG